MSTSTTQIPQTQTPRKFFVIGRHKFTQPQIQLLERIGFEQEVGRVTQVNNVADVVRQAKELGASAIVVQALPMHILAQLLTTAQKQGIPVLAFKIEAVATVPINEKCPTECDIEVPDPRSGNKRCSKTVAIQQIKRIVVEAEELATR